MATKTIQLADPFCEEFPIIMEQGKPKAFVVGIKAFQQIQIILDNLLHQESEAEDTLIATSNAFQKLLRQVDKEKPAPSSDWRQELRALYSIFFNAFCSLPSSIAKKVSSNSV